MVKLMDALDDHDDVKQVWSNFDIEEKEIEAPRWARVRVFGIDPGSERTGYGCVETDGQRHQLVACGAIVVPARATFPERLRLIHEGLTALIARQPARSGRHREPVPRGQRPQRAEARARARRRDAGGRRGRPARWSSTRRPRSSARSSATGAPRSSRSPEMVRLLLRSRRRARRRTTPPTRSRSRSVTCTLGRRHQRIGRGRRARAAQLAALAAARPAHARHDRAARGHGPRETSDAGDRRHRRRRLRRARAAVVVCRRRRRGQRRSTLRVHTHVREDALQLFGFATALEQTRVRAAGRGQRHRPEAGAVGAVGHRAARTSCSAISAGDVARLDVDPRHRHARPPSASCSSCKDKLAAHRRRPATGDAPATGRAQIWCRRS